MGTTMSGRQRDTMGRILFLLVAAAVLVIALLLFQNNEEKGTGFEPNVVVGAMPGKTAEAVQAELNQRVSEMTFAVNYNYNPCFEDGTSPGKILFENSSFNEGKLLRLEIYLGQDDTGTLLYSTGLLRPGSYVDEAPLDAPLGAGVYQCTAYIYAYRESDQSYIGKVLGDMRVSVLH